MGCIEKIYSVSALVGSSKCNANCSFCAAKTLRKDAQCTMPITFKPALRLSAKYGGWSLSLTGSGEPTCSPNSVTQALEEYAECRKEGSYFPNVNLFSNGIKLADTDFCKKYLPIWKELGLTSIAISVHDDNEIGQAKAYGINIYPYFKDIFRNIRKYGLQCRITLLLRKGAIDSPKRYKEAIEYFQRINIKNITSWIIGNPDGSRNEFSLSFFQKFLISVWLKFNTKKCHGHAWGGGVFDYNGTLLRFTDYVTKHDPNKDFVRQLVVFQDGLVAYSWIKEGAICLMP
jgi:sulfatase maturation enzyme AslB (radical SAM superfamily)